MIEVEQRLANARRQKEILQAALGQWNQLIVELEAELAQNKILKDEAGWS